MIYSFFYRGRLFFVFFFLLLGIIGQAQPANDDCEHAELIITSGIYSGTTVAATTDEAGEICNSFRSTTKGVWYKIIGNGNVVNISTCGEQTNFDTWLGVYKGNCGKLTCVTENDDLEDPCIFGVVASKASEVSFKAELGVIYSILVGGTQLETGNFTLGVFCEGGGNDCLLEEPLSLISLSEGSPSTLMENAVGAIEFTFSADKARKKDLIINYTIGGTATNGTDYDTLIGKVTLLKATTSTTVQVIPKGEPTIELDETVILTLAEGLNYTIETPSSQTGTITNDDFCPELGTIDLPMTTCVNEAFSMNIDGLAKMKRGDNGDQDFGIQFVTFATATETPYNGGKSIGIIPFRELLGPAASRKATLAIKADQLIVGDYVVYAILSPEPTNSVCRPFKKMDLKVNPAPTARIVSDVQGQICSGTNVQFTASGGTTYEFLLNNNPVQQGANTIYNNTNLAQGNIVKVIATNELACIDTSTAFIAQVNSIDTDEDSIPDCRDICPGGDDLGTDNDKDGMPDECDCDPLNADDAIIEVTGLFGQIPTGVYKAGSEISTIQKVNTENEVTFQAGAQILLKPGFTVEAGGLFHALIAPCKDPNALIEETTRTLPTAINFREVIENHQLELRIAPNPLVNQTTLNFFLPTAELVSLFIYDQTGRIVKQVLISEALEMGDYKMVLTKEDLKRSGFYYVVLQTLEKRMVQKLIKID